MDTKRSVVALVALLTLAAAPAAHAQEHRRQGTMVSSSGDDVMLAQIAADYTAAGAAKQAAADLRASAEQLLAETHAEMKELLDNAIDHEQRHGTTEKHVGQGTMLLGAGLAVGGAMLTAPALPVLLAAAVVGVGAVAFHDGRARVTSAAAASAARRAGASDDVVLDVLFGNNASRGATTTASAPAASSSGSSPNGGFHH